MKHLHGKAKPSSWGARNAGLYAVQLLSSLDDDAQVEALDRFKEELAAGDEKKAAGLAEKLQKDGLT